MNNSKEKDSRPPRKRFLVKKAAELVRSVKLSGKNDEGESFMSQTARKFNNLFSGNSSIQPQ